MLHSNQLIGHKPKYRADIDGLRAIAIFGVVIFHAFPNWLPGGFTGVDIFFVISGFLISTLVFEDLDANNFNYAQFYIRRIKRLFPALILVLLFCIVAGWFSLVQLEYKELGKQILASSLFLNNFLLNHETGYFDASSNTKMLLHLWSIGVEEQFYLFWPTMLLVIWKKKQKVFIYVLAILAASFFLNLIETLFDKSAAFYLPQNRLWELLSGALLAWLLYKKPYTQINFNCYKNKFSWLNYWPHIQTSLGLLLLLISFFTLNKTMFFPGYVALLPIIGTIFIIAAGSKAWLNSKFLAHRYIVWFGLISYPLYLWHWPLLVLARIINSNMLSISYRIIIVMIATILAGLTYHFVEKPIRFGINSNLKTITLVILMFVTGTLGFTIYLSNGFKNREVVAINNILINNLEKNKVDLIVKECGISDPNLKKNFIECSQDKRGHIKYALFGDSKAAALYSGVVRTSTSQGRWLIIGGPDTHLVNLSNNPSYEYFQKNTVTATQALAANKNIKVVVIVVSMRNLFFIYDGGFGNYNYNYLEKLNESSNYDSTFLGASNVISNLVKSGKKIVIVVDNPPLPHYFDCVKRKTSIALVNYFLPKNNPDCNLSLQKFENQTKLYQKLLMDLKNRYPKDVQIFDPTDIYCDKTLGVCSAIQNEHLIYEYTDHISYYTANQVGARLNAYLNKNYS